jgi:hypothetical protein
MTHSLNNNEKNKAYLAVTVDLVKKLEKKEFIYFNESCNCWFTSEEAVLKIFEEKDFILFG